MTNNGELHIVFGTGPVRMSVMEELVKRGRQIRMVNRSGRASVPEGVEVVGGDATDETFAREASRGASVVYFALNPPYTRWSELFPPLQAGVVEGAASAGAKLIAVENLYMYGLTGGRPLTEDLPHAPNTRKGTVRAAMAQELMEAQQDHGHGVGQYGSERGDGRPRPGQGRGGQGRHQREERQRLGGPRTGRRVHNNAGVYRSERSTTADGMEETFAVNHLAYFLLTNLLLDKLEAGAPPRIVNVASADHSNATIDFDSLQGEKGYRGARAYSQSKLANVLFTYELARRLQGTGVTANCLQPGVVDQPRQRGLWGLQVRCEGVAALMTSPEKGTETLIYLASSPEVEGLSGRYFAKKAEACSSNASHDERLATRLWDVSAELTNLPPQPRKEGQACSPSIGGDRLKIVRHAQGSSPSAASSPRG